MAGRKTICPRCQDVVPAPPAEAPALEEARPPAKDAPLSPRALSLPEVGGWPWPSRLGLLAAGCGVFALLTLCLPGSSYLAPLLSGGGLLLGLGALALALLDDEPGPGQLLAGRTGVARSFGTRAVDLPVVGVVACVVALAVTLLPLLME
jgi:hypothetical protein